VGLARVLAATNRDEEALTSLATVPEAGSSGAEVVKIRRTIEMRKNAATRRGRSTAAEENGAADPENAQG